MNFKDRLIQIILTWNDFKAHGLTDTVLRTLPSSYGSSEDFITTWKSIIEADFHIELCEETLQPLGHRAGFVSFRGK